MVSRESLFDIGADTAGLLIPGGSIAVKVARAAVDRDYRGVPAGGVLAAPALEGPVARRPRRAKGASQYPPAPGTLLRIHTDGQPWASHLRFSLAFGGPRRGVWSRRIERMAIRCRIVELWGWTTKAAEVRGCAGTLACAADGSDRAAYPLRLASH